MSIVATGALSRGYDVVYLEKAFRERRERANKHFGVPDYVGILQKDLWTTRERITKWPRNQPERVRLDRERIQRILKQLDYYGITEKSDSRDFFVLTPEDHIPKPGGIHLPGSHYIGPGTSDYTREVKSVADSVARKHDIAYSTAKSDADVRQADRTAISEFIDASSSDPVRGIIGAVGIGAKYLTESVIGVQYSGGDKKSKNPIGTFSDDDLRAAIEAKKHHTVTYMDTPPPSAEKRVPASSQSGRTRKQPRLDSPVENQPGTSGNVPATVSTGDNSNVEMAEAAAGGAATTYGTAGDNEGPVFIGQGHVPSSTRIYTKKFQLETMGFTPITVDGSSLWNGLSTAPNIQAVTKALCTPVAGIDPNLLPWYLTRAEFDNLSMYSIADRCRISVRPLGYRIPFATNQSISENANSSATLVQVVFGTGLNHKFDGSLGKITAASANPAKPTSFNFTGIDLESLLYAGEWASCLGTAPFYNQYYSINKFATPNLQLPQMPMLMKAVTIVNIADVRGEPIEHVEYKFKCAPLKWGTPLHTSSSLYHPGRSNAYYISSNKDTVTMPPNTGQRDYRSDAGHLFLDLEIASGESQNFEYIHQIEKCNYYVWRPEGEFSSILPPHINFGCMPLRSDVPITTDNRQITALPVTVIWEISTELIVREIHDFPLPDRMSPWQNHICLQTPRGFSTQMLNNVIDIPYYQGGSVAKLYPMGRSGTTFRQLKRIGKSTETNFSQLSGDPKNNADGRGRRDVDDEFQEPTDVPKRRKPLLTETPSSDS